MVEMSDSSGVQDNTYIGFIKRIDDGFPIKGAVTNIKKYSPDPEGELERDGIKYKLVEEKSVKNTVCNRGNALAARRFMADIETLKCDYMGVGTGTGGKTSASNALEAQVGTNRTVLDSGSVPADNTANDNVVTYVCTFPAGTGTGALVEAGMFTAITAGIMICYADFGVVTKGAADIVVFTWTVTLGSS
jgi:hypothetical protein